jgi:hypothetical protein
MVINPSLARGLEILLLYGASNPIFRVFVRMAFRAMIFGKR